MTNHSKFAMSYGQLEHMLADLACMDPGMIRAQFRKLLLRPFPDDIRSGVGNRMRYDLLRILAFAAAFELTSLSIAQSHAVALVEAIWPELCRAVLASAVERGLIARPLEMEEEDGPILQLGSGSVFVGRSLVVDVLAVKQLDLAALAVRPVIAIDARRTLDKLMLWAEAQGKEIVDDLSDALSTLGQMFGWTPLEVYKGYSDDMPRGASFLNEGPYLTRAMAFLKTMPSDLDAQLDPAARIRLQSIFGYLETPSPIDAWKTLLAARERTFGLRYELTCHARRMNLRVRTHYPTTVETIAPRRDETLELVESAIGRWAGGPVGRDHSDTSDARWTPPLSKLLPVGATAQVALNGDLDERLRRRGDDEADREENGRRQRSCDRPRNAEVRRRGDAPDRRQVRAGHAGS